MTSEEEDSKIQMQKTCLINTLLSIPLLLFLCFVPSPLTKDKEKFIFMDDPFFMAMYFAAIVSLAITINVAIKIRLCWIVFVVQLILFMTGLFGLISRH